MRDSNRNLLQLTFERAGVVINLDSGSGPGVRFLVSRAPQAADQPATGGPAIEVLERMEADISEDRNQQRRKRR